MRFVNTVNYITSTILAQIGYFNMLDLRIHCCYEKVLHRKGGIPPKGSQMVNSDQSDNGGTQTKSHYSLKIRYGISLYLFTSSLGHSRDTLKLEDEVLDDSYC